MKHVASFLVSGTAILACLIGGYAISLWPQPSNNPVTTTETEAIGPEQAVGGVVAKTQTNSASNAPIPNDVDSVMSSFADLENAAPKQAEIKRMTPVEYEYRALRVSNDPLQQSPWVLNATKASSAWDTATGNGAVVAVIDSGFALNHEDLMSQWYLNDGETGSTSVGERCWTGTVANKATNSCDDDSNGYLDDWRGWDFVDSNNLPQAGETNPNGQAVAHGTQVAGLVGAAGNNGKGSATISWNNTIMPLQALSDDGSGYTSAIAAAIYYAVDNGATVINMSLGGDTNDPTLAAALRYAYNNNVVAVAAAGNCGTGTEQGCDPGRPGAMSYPALNPHVIAVGATTSNGGRASFSSFGPGLDVSAPGSGAIISPMWHATNQITGYATSLYGTSFASPIVASYIGLLKAIRPSSSVEDISALVNATAGKPSGMGADVYSESYGHGIIDSEAGLRVARSLNGTSGTPILAQTGDTNSEHTFKSTATISSGCETSAPAYCTVWATNTLGYDRYLPYTQTNFSGQAGWTWSGRWLGSGDWSLKTRSGNNVSTTPYQLFSK